MNRVYVRTIVVLLLIAFASMGTLVLTDNFVPQAHAGDDCFQEALECLIAIRQAINICADVGIFAPECLAAAENAITECEEAWEASVRKRGKHVSDKCSCSLTTTLAGEARFNIRGNKARLRHPSQFRVFIQNRLRCLLIYSI